MAQLLDNVVDQASGVEKNDSPSPSTHGTVVTSPPPNGGSLAWIQVGCGFCCMFCSFGIVNSFAVYQDYYEAVYLSDLSPSDISWIGSVQACLVYGGSFLVGRLVDAGYVRPVVWTGSFLVVFGQMMTSLSTNWYQLFLAQGLCMGLGCGFLYNSAISVVPTYFTTLKATAMGIMATGSSCSGVLMPIMLQRLFKSVGFAWASRALGFITLGMTLPVCLFMKSRLPPRKFTVRSLIDLEALTEPTFVLFCLGLVLVSAGLFTPLFFIQPFSAYIGADKSAVTYIVPILNAASSFGRLLPNMLADKVGVGNMLIPCCTITSVLCFCWIRVHNTAGLVIYAVCFGFFSGSFISLPPAFLARSTDDMSKLGTRFGMAFLMAGAAVLLSGPVAGRLITNSGGSYVTAAIYAGALFISGTLCFFLMRQCELKRKGQSFLSKI